MAYASVNGLDALSARIELPRFGAWTGALLVDAPTAAQVPEGSPASITYGPLSFSGTVFRVDDFSDQVMLQVVGGTNRLGQNCQKRFYQGVPMSTVLDDLVGDAGETVSSSSSQSILGTVLPFWTMVQQPVGHHLSLLAAKATVGCVWRILADGSVFFGVDGFAPAPGFEFDLLEYPADQGYQLIHSEAPLLSPGMSFNGKTGGEPMNVSVIVYTLKRDDLTMKVWFET